MTHVSCSNCRLRFSRTLAAHLAECPLCGSVLDRGVRGEPMVGFRLFDANSPEPQGVSTDGPAPRTPADAISIRLEP
jgi:hypothetical protein